MAFFGKNGFVRKQEVAFAKKLLAWKYQNAGRDLPSDAEITAHAQQVVEEAHVIAKERGTNVLEILKGMIRDFKNKKR